jgi:hypothetical protein
VKDRAKQSVSSWYQSARLITIQGTYCSRRADFIGEATNICGVGGILGIASIGSCSAKSG